MSGKRLRHGMPLCGVTEAFDIPPSTNRRELVEAARLLQIAVQNELTPRQRTCLLLYYEKNLTMQEIAERTGISRGMVCRHIHKAVERLRRSLRYSRLGTKLL